MDHLLAPGIWQIDTLLGGWEEVNAVFLVEGPRPCLVETGPQLNGDTVIEALRGRGLGPDDLGSVILTHIHLDHGGAVGEVAAQFSRATIYCHPKGVHATWRTPPGWWPPRGWSTASAWTRSMAG